MAKQKLKKKSDNEKAIFWLIIISIFVVIFIGIGGTKLFQPSDNSSEEINNSNLDQNNNLLYFVNRDTYAATSEEYFDEMFDYFKINDQQSIAKMLRANDVVILPKGSQVNIIEYEYTFSIVREKGSRQKYWVVQEHLSKLKE